MGDENPIRTLGDYSKPSHEGYRNTIELPVGNNVVPLRSDTIRRTTKLRNDILMFQQHHGESLSEAWTHFKDLLQKVSHHGIDLWLQATIEELARYEDEGWNDLVASGEGSLDYENPDIEQLLGVMKCKVDTLMKEAISLMGRSESVFGMTSDTVYQLPSGSYRQEEFKDLVMNFILDQEEKVRQLEEYMCVIGSDFMQLSLEVVGKLREEIRIEQNRTKKINKITGYPDTEDLKPLNDQKNLETLTKEVPSHTPKIVSPRKAPSFNEPGPQPNPLPNYPSLDVSLGKERCFKPPNKPCSSDGFRMKEVDYLTIRTPPSSLMASFHPKDTGSLGVDFSNMVMIENDWELESKEVSFLGRGLNLPVWPKEVEKVRIK
ncbi:hypothetical protein Tco_0201995 [Tanacetum coccineum]